MSLDSGVRYVGARRQTNPHCTAFTALEAVRMDFGPSIAGVTSGNEIDPISELTVRHDDCGCRASWGSEVDAPGMPSLAIGWSAQDHHVDGGSSVGKA